MPIRKHAGVMLVTLLFAGVALAQAPDAKPVRIRGDIVSLQGDFLTVHRRSGDTVSIEVKPDVGVWALKAISLSDVGSYVGAEATAGSDGKMTAGSLLVFPDGARGTNEGHFPYDFGANNTMTNANVDTIVTANNGRELKLSSKGGTKMVTVPESASVVTFAPTTGADLTAGKKVFVLTTPTKGGVFEAHVLPVEKDGVVPPI